MPAPSSLKHKLQSKAITVGSWITLAHPGIAEIMAKAGFDWLVIDLEHSTITIREAEELIRVLSFCAVPPLVRLSANDPVQAKRVMDAGAHGLIVPMVNSKEDADKAVSSMYYPTKGRRGVGLARAQGYGTAFDTYKEWLNNEAVLIFQIEHIEAVKNLEQILSVTGVDGYIIGPYDLSASLGAPGQFDHPDVFTALKQIREVAGRLGVPGGVHVIQPDPAEIRHRIEEGFTFLGYSLDILMLGTMCQEGLAAIKACSAP